MEATNYCGPRDGRTFSLRLLLGAGAAELAVPLGPDLRGAACEDEGRTGLAFLIQPLLSSGQAPTASPSPSPPPGHLLLPETGAGAASAPRSLGPAALWLAIVLAGGGG